jgi:toxin ParE1/3/4
MKAEARRRFDARAADYPNRSRRQDLTNIRTAITADNSNVADRVLDTIEDGWQQLARHPQSGMASGDIAPSIRHLMAADI